LSSLASTSSDSSCGQKEMVDKGTQTCNGGTPHASQTHTPLIGDGVHLTVSRGDGVHLTVSHDVSHEE
jgi:hypothetical protein